MEAQANTAQNEQEHGNAVEQHKDVYTIVTERIIEQLEKGTVPWRQPWTDAGIPSNLISKRPYRGINVMLLAMLGYEQNLFLTFKQVKDLGGKVMKGENGHLVVYWNYVERMQGGQDASEEKAQTEWQQAKKVPMLRYYTVFNISQCENLPKKYLTKEEHNWQPLETCDEIIEKMPQRPEIVNKQQKAFYDPLKDYINMPKFNSFVSQDAYYSTLFHELIHSTGHRSRLDRKDLLQMAEFGYEPYSHEELVAEIGGCFLQSFAGIMSEFEQSAAYIQSWIAVLRNDVRFIFSACTQAQKATDFIVQSNDLE